VLVEVREVGFALPVPAQLGAVREVEYCRVKVESALGFGAGRGRGLGGFASSQSSTSPCGVGDKRASHARCRCSLFPRDLHRHEAKNP
jgi:hypothetical protein